MATLGFRKYRPSVQNQSGIWWVIGEDWKNMVCMGGVNSSRILGSLENSGFDFLKKIILEDCGYSWGILGLIPPHPPTLQKYLSFDRTGQTTEILVGCHPRTIWSWQAGRIWKVSFAQFVQVVPKSAKYLSMWCKAQESHINSFIKNLILWQWITNSFVLV